MLVISKREKSEILIFSFFWIALLDREVVPDTFSFANFFVAQDFDSVISPNPLWVVSHQHNLRALRDNKIFQTKNHSLTEWFLYQSVLLVRTETSLVATVGLEPTTCRVWTGCSSQLSYVAISVKDKYYYNREKQFCQQKNVNLLK